MPLLLEISTEQLYNFYKDSMTEMEFYKIMGSDSKRTPIKGALLDAVKNKAISPLEAESLSTDYDSLDAIQKQRFNNNIKKENININDINILKKYLNDFFDSENEDIFENEKFSMIDRETMLLYEDDTWRIISPLSPNSSRKHCGKSHWCTASGSYGYYFPMYTTQRNACLISFFNKKNEENSFQIAIDINKYVNNQCDFADNSVSHEWVIGQVGQELYDKVTNPSILSVLISATKKNVNKEVKKASPFERMPFSSLMRVAANIFFSDTQEGMGEISNYVAVRPLTYESNPYYYFVHTTHGTQLGLIFDKIDKKYVSPIPIKCIIQPIMADIGISVVQLNDDKYNILKTDGSYAFSENVNICQKGMYDNQEASFLIDNGGHIIVASYGRFLDSPEDIMYQNTLGCFFMNGKIKYSKYLGMYYKRLGVVSTGIDEYRYKAPVIEIAINENKDSFASIEKILKNINEYPELHPSIKKLIIGVSEICKREAGTGEEARHDDLTYSISEGIRAYSVFGNQIYRISVLHDGFNDLLLSLEENIKIIAENIGYNDSRTYWNDDSTLGAFGYTIDNGQYYYLFSSPSSSLYKVMGPFNDNMEIFETGEFINICKRTRNAILVKIYQIDKNFEVKEIKGISYRGLFYKILFEPKENDFLKDLQHFPSILIHGGGIDASRFEDFAIDEHRCLLPMNEVISKFSTELRTCFSISDNLILLFYKNNAIELKDINNTEDKYIFHYEDGNETYIRPAAQDGHGDGVFITDYLTGLRYILRPDLTLNIRVISRGDYGEDNDEKIITYRGDGNLHVRRNYNTIKIGEDKIIWYEGNITDDEIIEQIKSHLDMSLSHGNIKNPNIIAQAESFIKELSQKIQKARNEDSLNSNDIENMIQECIKRILNTK